MLAHPVPETRAAKAGDIFLPTNSGHGGRVQDRSGDDPDGQETWCLYDGELIDDEIYVALGRSRVMAHPVFADRCSDASLERRSGDDERDCHMTAGFSIGTPTCPLWEEIGKLCQTDAEKRFLRWYLELVKDREFPMLIPQPRIGIAERRRPDFVAFVPLHYWSYKRYAIQVDGAHPREQGQEDRLRDAEISVHGYKVLSVRGSLRDVQWLVEQIERDMASVESDPWPVALQVAVARTDPPPAEQAPASDDGEDGGQM